MPISGKQFHLIFRDMQQMDHIHPRSEDGNVLSLIAHKVLPITIVSHKNQCSESLKRLKPQLLLLFMSRCMLVFYHFHFSLSIRVTCGKTKFPSIGVGLEGVPECLPK